DWDVARLLDHLIADLETFNRVASGEPADLVADIDPTAPDNVGRAWPNPAQHLERLVKESQELWSRPGALEQKYKTSRSEMPGEALVMVTLIDTLVHGWDLAKATGQEAEMPADVAEAALAFTTKMMKDKRIGFGEPVPVPDDASVTDRLVGWLGRQP
ncbi:MAG TPA: TIGR03086 family metal-binding protein, partial [Actinomycetota bacterium]|nr:TIGR03086 family metal-binding protein [Actinomycetota bacterium]